MALCDIYGQGVEDFKVTLQTEDSIRVTWVAPVRWKYALNYVLTIAYYENNEIINTVSISKNASFYIFNELQSCTYFTIRIAAKYRHLGTFSTIYTNTSPKPATRLQILKHFATGLVVKWSDPYDDVPATQYGRGSCSYTWKIIHIRGGIEDKSNINSGKTTETSTKIPTQHNGGTYAIEICAVLNEAISRVHRIALNLVKITRPVDIIFIADVSGEFAKMATSLITQIVASPILKNVDNRYGLVKSSIGQDSASMEILLRESTQEDFIRQCHEIQYPRHICNKLHSPSTIIEVFKAYRDSKDVHYAIIPRNCFAIYITQRVNFPEECAEIKKACLFDEEIESFCIGVGFFKDNTMKNLERLASSDRHWFVCNRPDHIANVRSLIVERVVAKRLKMTQDIEQLENAAKKAMMITLREERGRQREDAGFEADAAKEHEDEVPAKLPDKPHKSINIVRTDNDNSSEYSIVASAGNITESSYFIPSRKKTGVNMMNAKIRKEVKNMEDTWIAAMGTENKTKGKKKVHNKVAELVGVLKTPMREMKKSGYTPLEDDYTATRTKRK